MAHFQALGGQVSDAWKNKHARRERLTPDDLMQGMRRIEISLNELSAASSDEQGAQATPQQLRISELAELAIELSGEMAALGSGLGLDQVPRQLREMPADIALWAALQGAAICSPGPVAEALAQRANSILDPQQLARLFRDISHVMDAVAPAARSRDGAGRPAAPWRALLMNRAIVATRSLDPGLMTQAFNDLVRELPDDAPPFFAEGMKQLEIVGYPPEVSTVITRYYAQFGLAPDSLH